MNIQNVNRLNNEYRAYIYEAESYRMAQAGVASREEGLSYQRAAQICSQLASLTTGSEAQYWMKNQAACEMCIRDRRRGRADPVCPPVPEGLSDRYALRRGVHHLEGQRRQAGLRSERVCVFCRRLHPCRAGRVVRPSAGPLPRRRQRQRAPGDVYKRQVTYRAFPHDSLSFIRFIRAYGFCASTMISTMIACTSTRMGMVMEKRLCLSLIHISASWGRIFSCCVNRGGHHHPRKSL